MMATGRGPFQGNAIALLYQHSTAKPDAPSKHNPAVSPRLDPIILKCLEKDPADRYQSAAEILEDLEDCFRKGETQVTPWYRSPFKIAAAVILVGALVTLGILAGRGGKNTEFIPDTFEYAVEEACGQAVTEETGTYYTTTDAISLRGTAPPRSTVEVYLSSGGNEPVLNSLICNEEGLFGGQVPIPVNELGIDEGGRIDVALRVKGDSADPQKALAITYDPKAPQVSFRVRQGPWTPVERGTSIKALTLDDITFRFADEGSGFEDNAERVTELLLPIAPGDEAERSWSRGAARVVLHENDSFQVECKDRAGNEFDNLIALVRTTPTLQVKEAAARSNEDAYTISVDVTVDPAIDIESQPLERLVAICNGEPTPLNHVSGGRYEGELTLRGNGQPDERAFDVTFEHAERKLTNAPKLRIIRDTRKPVITLTCASGAGDQIFRSGAQDNPDSVTLTDKINTGQLLKLSVIDPGELGSLGDAPQVSIGFEVGGVPLEPTLHPVIPGQEQALPAPLPASAEPFFVLIKTRDEAGNTAEVKAKILVTNVLIQPIGAGVHEGALYVPGTKNLTLEMREVGLPGDRTLHAEIHDSKGNLIGKREALQRTGDHQWTWRNVTLPENTPFEVVLFDHAKSGELGAPVGRFDIVPDEQAPRVSAAVQGIPGLAPASMSIGHFPTLRLKIEDDRGIGFEPGDLVLNGQGVTHRVVSRKPTSIEIAIESKADIGGKYSFALTPKDRAGNTGRPWRMALEVAPPRVSVTSLNGVARAANGAGDSTFLSAEPKVDVIVRNGAGRGNFSLRALLKGSDDDEERVIELDPLAGSDIARSILELSGGRGRIKLQHAEVLSQGAATPWTTFDEFRYVIDGRDPVIQIYNEGNLVPFNQVEAGLFVSDLSSLTVRVSDNERLPDSPLLVAGRSAADAGFTQVDSAPQQFTFRFPSRSFQSETFS